MGHDDPIKEMRNNVEEIWKEGASKRILRTLSSKPKFGGFSLFADNVGKVKQDFIVYLFKLYRFLVLLDCHPSPQHRVSQSEPLPSDDDNFGC